MKRIVVIPAYNESSTIKSVVTAALACSDAVIVANDSSTDFTRELAIEAGAIVVDVPRDRPGLVGVYVHGLKAALNEGATQVCELDAGGSHDPSMLPIFWCQLDDHAIAAASRFSGGMHIGSVKRRWLSLTGTILINFLHRQKFADATSGYIAYRANALKAILSTPYVSRGHFYQSEVRLRAAALNMQISEVPIRYVATGSSLNWKAIWEAARLLFRRYK